MNKITQNLKKKEKFSLDTFGSQNKLLWTQMYKRTIFYSQIILALEDRDLN